MLVQIRKMTIVNGHITNNNWFTPVAFCLSIKVVPVVDVVVEASGSNMCHSHLKKNPLSAMWEIG